MRFNMKQKKIFWYIIIFSFLLSGKALSPGKGVVEGFGTHVLSITVNNGLITLEADKVPLETVLQGLSQKTGAKFIIHPPRFPPIFSPSP
jgi:hypothetical protein